MSLLQWINIANAGMFSVINEHGSTRFGGFRPAVRVSYCARLDDAPRGALRLRSLSWSRQDKDTLSNFCKEYLEEVAFEEVPKPPLPVCSLIDLLCK